MVWCAGVGLIAAPVQTLAFLRPATDLIELKLRAPHGITPFALPTYKGTAAELSLIGCLLVFVGQFALQPLTSTFASERPADRSVRHRLPIPDGGLHPRRKDEAQRQYVDTTSRFQCVDSAVWGKLTPGPFPRSARPRDPRRRVRVLSYEDRARRDLPARPPGRLLCDRWCAQHLCGRAWGRQRCRPGGEGGAQASVVGSQG